jgi:arabinofuranosyltransferase
MFDKSRNTNRVLVGVLLAIALLYCAFQVVAKRGSVFDDAFITYRYAKNLAEGNGITWNAGEAPVEGYTNFLLVVVLAPVIRVGGDPQLFARILNLLAGAGVAVLLYQATRREWGAERAVALVAAAAFLMGTKTGLVAMLGLETVVFALAALGALVAFRWFVESSTFGRGLLVAVLVLLAFLLRPEAVLLPVAMGVALIRTPRANSQRIRTLLAAGAVGCLGPLLAYFALKQWHFGTVVPNPFYLKARDVGFASRMGLWSILTFLLNHKALVGLAVASVVVPQRFLPSPWGGGQGVKCARSAAGVTVVLYLLFYVRVDTLMDFHGRFLYPVAAFLAYLALPVLCAVTRAAFAWRAGVLVKVPLVCVLFAGVLFALSYRSTWASVLGVAESMTATKPVASAAPSEPARPGLPLMQMELKAGRALAGFPGIRGVRIAFGDAGVIPYFSNALHLDVVGLNNRFIARERDLGRLVDYFFAEEPDLVLHPANKDHSWFSGGHGPLGDTRAWSGDPRWDEYEYAGTLRTAETYDVHVFVRRGYGQADALLKYLRQRVVDGIYREFPIAIGSYAPAGGSVWEASKGTE